MSEEMSKLIGALNSINQKIDEMPMIDIAIDTTEFKDLCNKKQRILKEIEDLKAKETLSI